MRSISFILAILGTAAAVGGLALLINTVSTDANSLKALISCVLFLGGSVAAASGWVKALNITITPNITGAID